MDILKTWEFNCPLCASNERIAQQVVDRNKADGKLDKGILFGAINVIDTPITDPGKKLNFGDTISVILRFTDICTNCGTLYIFRVELREHKVTMDVSKLIQPAPNAPGLPFGFPSKPGGN